MKKVMVDVSLVIRCQWFGKQDIETMTKNRESELLGLDRELDERAYLGEVFETKMKRTYSYKCETCSELHFNKDRIRSCDGCHEVDVCEDCACVTDDGMFCVDCT